MQYWKERLSNNLPAKLRALFEVIAEVLQHLAVPIIRKKKQSLYFYISGETMLLKKHKEIF